MYWLNRSSSPAYKYKYNQTALFSRELNGKKTLVSIQSRLMIIKSLFPCLMQRWQNEDKQVPRGCCYSWCVVVCVYVCMPKCTCICVYLCMLPMTRVLELSFMRFSKEICDTHFPSKVHHLRKLMWQQPMWNRPLMCGCHVWSAMNEQECQHEVSVLFSMAITDSLGRDMVWWSGDGTLD